MGKKLLLDLYTELYKKYGPQHWWPGESRFEIIIGAILTQNTNWGNVERAINNLKKAHLLTLKKIKEVNIEKLKKYIQPAGFYNQKAQYIKNIVLFFEKIGCNDIEHCNIKQYQNIREQILKVKGIGPETCDSILLYAFNLPYFVVDAYTKRFIKAKNIPITDLKYHVIQDYFHKNLPIDPKLYNEYHALIVRWGKENKKNL